VSIFLGAGNRAFAPGARYSVGKPLPYAIVAADFNRDGRPDLAQADYGSADVSVFTGQGSGAFPAPTYWPAGASPWQLAVADVNGDGKVDLITGNATGPGLSVLLNTSK
jgi:hypothetical protein